MIRKARLFTILALLVCIGCSEGESDASNGGELVLYSGRGQSLIEPLLHRFEEDTGIKVRVKYGSSAQLAMALQEEGIKSPADLFWAQDAGALGVLSKASLFAKLPKDIIDQVPPRFCHARGEWVATSARARVVAYSPSRVDVDALPRSVLELTGPEWKARVGWAPLNASFQTCFGARHV